MDSLEPESFPAQAADLAPRSKRLHRSSVRSSALWSLIALLCLAGCLGLLNSLLTLWTIWTTDPLRSIGMLIPPASILLTLRVWRQMGWQMRGSLWGLLLVALAYLLNFSRQSLVLTGSLSTVAFFSFNPVALPLFLYASGLALLFAGPAVCRKAWFPLGLLLLAQPVPNISTQFVDLPLQHLSAEVARAFATLIGFAPNTPQLRLMFSPTFGMFIAPGCDGIRGAVAMGYIALLLGYLKRVSWPRWAAYVFGAVLLGYLFNFTRLCLLVLYYRLALGHPAMESVAKQADYGIGSCLFLFAAFLFLRLVYRRQDERPAEAVFSPTPTPHAARLLAACAGLLALTAMALALPGARPGSLHRNTLPTATLLSRLPYRVGPYDLTRSWYEQQNGTVVLIAGAYSAPGTDEVTLGVWVAPNSSIHDVNYCYLARGQEPTSSSVQTYSTGSGGSASFNMSRYSDGITDSLVASAFCTPGSCSDLLQTTSKDKLGVSFVLPHLNDLSHVNGRVSFMIRVEEPHGADAPQVIDRRLTQEIAHYIAGLKINALSAAFQ